MYLIAFPRSPGRIAVYFESFCVLLRIDKAGVDTHARVLRACASWSILLRAFASRGKSRPRIQTKKTRREPGPFRALFILPADKAGQNWYHLIAYHFYLRTLASIYPRPRFCLSRP